MTDQGNQNTGGQQDPLAGGQQGVPVPPVPTPLVSPAPGVPPVSPAAPAPPVPVPTAPMPPAPAPAPVAPTPMPTVPMPTAPMPAAVPQPMAPMSPARPAAPAVPAKPQKPMTLEDLAKQTPIFSDEELDEDDFDPWAPLDDAKKEEDFDDDFEEDDINTDDVKVTMKEDTKPEIKPVSASEPKKEIKEEAPAPDLVTEVKADESSEIIEGDIVGEEIDDPFEGIEEDGENPLKDFLKNANIDAKRIVGCAVAFVVIIIVVIGLIFGGKVLFNYLSTDRPEKIQKEEVVVEEVVEKEEVVKEEVVVKKVEKEEVVKKLVEELSKEDTVVSSWVDPSLYAGIKFGEEAAVEVIPGIPVIETPESDIVSSVEDTARYVAILGRIKNLYEADIQDMLDASTDRNRTLSEMLSEMKTVHKDALTALSAVEIRKVEIQTEFDEITAEKQLKEDSYFNSLTVHDSTKADQDLQSFIILARDSVDLRARYRALDKIEDFLGRYSDVLEKRIRDVEFNREALIKGVKVIDIEGSNIELIIPESAL
ncbi:hypothetical protein HOG48_02730 [Candidatus Peregrinibacteria bacterium]|jgi:hypothetical protein|nr:hypothetical protein [Candidatus Peregrinibacteria bacterium]